MVVVLFMIAIFVPSITAATDIEKQAQSTTISKIGEVSSKEEVVYGTLAANGKPQGVYVINILDVVESGGITDYGTYKDIKNLTTVHDIEHKDQTITAYADIGKFYYQGNMEEAQLPWDIGIKYYLDGKEISAKELAGKSGKLKMELATYKTAISNQSFYENFMLQISVTLDTEQAKNIQAEDAMFANSGHDKLITFTVMPNTEGKMYLEADVSDFTMEGISIAAVPFSMDIDLPDTEGIEKDLNTLSDAINTLNKGVDELKNGAGSLSTGAKSLQKGSTEYKAGIGELDQKSSDLIEGSAKINQALSTISNKLASNMDLSVLEEISELPFALSQFAGGIEGISSGLKELLEGYEQAYSALDVAIQGIPEPSLSEADLGTLTEEAQTNERIRKLLANYESAQMVKGIFTDTNAQLAFSSVLGLGEVVESLDKMSQSLNGLSMQISNSLQEADLENSVAQLTQLASGMAELAGNYSEFHAGLKAYTGGVSNLAGGYGEIHSGINGIADGAGGLADGTKKLSKGMNKLNDETKNMPDLVSDMMDELMGDFDTSDYVPTSFVSDKNENIKAVQFVLTTEAIEKEKEPDIDEPVEEENFWDRLLNLFKDFL